MAAPVDVRLYHPQPPQAPARAVKCDRHPEQPVTGFCSSCLLERLAGLEPAARRLLKPSPSSSGAPAAIKSLFPPAAVDKSSGAAAAGAITFSSSSLPELRRCRSFSGSGGAPPAAAVEPKRRSCDVRVRSTLWSLFHVDDEPIGSVVSRSSAARGDADLEHRSLGFAPPLPEEEGEDDQDEEDFRDAEDTSPRDDEVRVIGDEVRAELSGVGLRPMKDHIDLEAKSKASAKGTKDFAGSFWLAASVFSKKLQKWRRSQAAKKREDGTRFRGSSATAKRSAAIRVGRSSSRSNSFFGETPSDLAEDILGRRSCETDPRLSLDVGRISLDGPRYSLDEARASWDGYQARSSSRHVPLRPPPMISVTEDARGIAAHHRSDAQIPVEEYTYIPGGTAQTREYYTDSMSQRRRRSLDRSSSAHRSSVDGTDGLPLKPASIARISPTAVANEYFHHVHEFQRDEPTCNKDRLSGQAKGFRRWSRGWNLFGLLHQRRERESPCPGAWPENQGEEIVCRSSCSCRVHARCSTDCGSGGRPQDKERKSGLSSHAGGELLGLYMTPPAGGRRSKGLEKNWSDASHSLASDILRLY